MACSHRYTCNNANNSYVLLHGNFLSSLFSLRSGIADVREMLNRNMKVGLGTG